MQASRRSGQFVRLIQNAAPNRTGPPRSLADRLDPGTLARPEVCAACRSLVDRSGHGRRGVPGMTASCYDLPDSTIQPAQTCAMDVFTFKPAVTGSHWLSILMRFTDGVGVVDLLVSAKGKG